MDNEALNAKRCVVKLINNDGVFVCLENEKHHKNTQLIVENTLFIDSLWEGAVINAVGYEITNNEIHAKFIVIEPDILINITSIANCFQDYGTSALNYLISFFSQKETSQPILLGYLASQMLDNCIQSPHSTAATAIKQCFKNYPLDFCFCKNFSPTSFKADAETQLTNIKNAIATLNKKGANKQNSLIEPSFLCPTLGLKGRADLLTDDKTIIVEQKSGRNFKLESIYAAHYSNKNITKHNVQLQLYLAVLNANYNILSNQTEALLMYSKYKENTTLQPSSFDLNLIIEALNIRNNIVCILYKMSMGEIWDIINLITIENINTKTTNNSFFNKYILPDIRQIINNLHSFSTLEKHYFTEMLAFIATEQILSAKGTTTKQGTSLSDLWLMPFEEKLKQGTIIANLTIEHKETLNEDNGFCAIIFKKNNNESLLTNNFREGDFVYVYQQHEVNKPEITKQLVFNGIVTDNNDEQIAIKLTNPQPSSNVFQETNNEGNCVFYAVEHAASDSLFAAQIRSIYSFLTSSNRKKQLLLSETTPQKNNNIQLSHPQNNHLDSVILKAMQAEDFFLLCGPPGTGKTSTALKRIVEEELTRTTAPSPALLLMAYTNKAVDEICFMLKKNNIDFIRIGNEQSTDLKLRPYLLQNQIKNNNGLKEIRDKIQEAKVIVATTSTIINKTYLFNIKHFSLAIADEASQITEPAIVGILSNSAINKFILIGDTKQLPAVSLSSIEQQQVNCKELQHIGLVLKGNSLFERLLINEKNNNRTNFFDILHAQGRMHSQVAEFIKREFYKEEQLTEVPLPHQNIEGNVYETTPKNNLEHLLNNNRMVFINVNNEDEKHIKGNQNQAEAKVVAEVLNAVKRLMHNNFNDETSIGVIVPYRNQITEIRKAIANMAQYDFKDITIDTVERFQGSQREVIIYCLTAKNTQQMQFITQNKDAFNPNIDRKLNVALTRARMQNIIIGNKTLWKQCPVYAKLISFIEEKQHR